MAKNVKTHNPEEGVEQAITSTEHFIEKHKNHIIYGFVAVIVIVGLALAYKHLYRAPRIKEAMAQTFTAEQYFRADSFAVALNGDGNALGFKQIIKEYGSLAGDAVYFYAGTCELQMGNYQNAMDYFNKYSVKDPIMQARAICCIGDCYAGLKNNNEAVNYYMKAADFNDNPMAAGYLLKAGIMYEELGDTAKAVETYQKIKDHYPQTLEGYEIDKYISRIQLQ